MAAPQTSQVQKDTRPLRDRPFQAKMRQDVFHYLNESGFEISMQSLTSMQGKDYRAIFDTLLLTLDPCYPLREGARFEDEFIPALKALKYPFAHQIDPKWLAAVASPHSWPYLLGVLHWLVELCKACHFFRAVISIADLVQDAKLVSRERGSNTARSYACTGRV